ncbi:hypothetical protein PYW07_014176 [Mythimna separata]|uniref:Uncharacterized protein n=1 Tax=Mythimna separata TaxID=271217 RepID=A0AAD7Z1G3_MYTSE|nr:hypothetical protein PYW07_014176 [Mythimna separata]
MMEDSPFSPRSRCARSPPPTPVAGPAPPPQAPQQKNETFEAITTSDIQSWMTTIDQNLQEVCTIAAESKLNMDQKTRLNALCRKIGHSTSQMAVQYQYMKAKAFQYLNVAKALETQLDLSQQLKELKLCVEEKTKPALGASFADMVKKGANNYIQPTNDNNPIRIRRAAAPEVVEGGCINDQTRDPNTGECVSCPPGQERDGETNECVTIVTRIFVDDCPDGYTTNDKGQCVPIALRRLAAPDVLKAGCIPGQTRDPVTGYCLTCPPGQERDGETNECVTIVTRRFFDDCPDGYITNGNGKCVPIALRRLAAPDVLKAGCIPGQTRDPVTGYCLTCPPGQERDGETNECVTIVTRRFVDDCPDGYTTNDKGQCVPIALRRLAAPDVLKAGCIPGQTRDPVTGYCLTCPPGQERDGETNECVTIVTRRLLADCRDGYIKNDKGKCVPLTVRRVAAPDVLSAGCIPGQTKDPVTGYCLTCPPGQERDAQTNECVTIVTRRFAFRRVASPEVYDFL